MFAKKVRVAGLCSFLRWLGLSAHLTVAGKSFAAFLICSVFLMGLGSNGFAEETAEGLANSAGFLGMKGDCKKAVEAATKAIELDPSLESAYNNRAACLKELFGCKKAIPDWDKAVELDPRDGTQRMARAVCRLESGNDEGAFEDFKAAARHKKKYCKRIRDESNGRFSCDVSTRTVTRENK